MTLEEFLYSTHTFIGAIEDVTPPVTFLRDRYFPTVDDVDIFASDDILVEYKEGSKRLAPFVHPRKGGKNVARNGSTVSRYTPPLIAPSRSLTIDDLKRKNFAEAIFSKMTPEERAQAFALKDAIELRELIDRREEAMSAEVMLTNSCTMKSVEDENGEKVVITDDVVFYSEESNPAAYTPTLPWNSGSPHVISDLEIMARMLTKRGLAVADLVCSPDVSDVIINDDEIQKLLDIKNYAIGRVQPEQLSDGAAIIANLTILGRNINIISYDESYTDDDGEDKLYIPSGYCVLTAPAAGHTLYGAVSQMEQNDNEWHTYANKRVPKFYANAKENVRELTVSARPLPAPKRKNCFISAKVLS